MASTTFSTAVLRAASAGITELFVPRDLIDLDDALDVGRRPAGALGVKAFAGYPLYTPREWDARPAWMQTEPWQTRYEVNAALEGFTRGRSA